MVDFLSEIIKRLKDAEKDTKEALASGANIHNFENFQRLLGTREGLTQALDIIDRLLTESEEEDN
jgi:hypothetical protein